jgi:hypothetical protein
VADADEGGRLTGLDWVVIVAAAVSLVVLITWMVQGQPGLPQPKTDP